MIVVADTSPLLHLARFGRLSLFETAPGPVAAILLAESLGAEAVVMDERRGRAVATSRGLAVIGTLGVLAGAHRAGALERVAPVIAALRADGFWLADDLVASYLARLGRCRRGWQLRLG
jgi:hypothetical protein